MVDADLVSEAERAFKFGDSELSDRIQRNATDGIPDPSTNGNGHG